MLPGPNLGIKLNEASKLLVKEAQKNFPPERFRIFAIRSCNIGLIVSDNSDASMCSRRIYLMTNLPIPAWRECQCGRDDNGHSRRGGDQAQLTRRITDLMAPAIVVSLLNALKRSNKAAFTLSLPLPNCYDSLTDNPRPYMPPRALGYLGLELTTRHRQLTRYPEIVPEIASKPED